MIGKPEDQRWPILADAGDWRTLAVFFLTVASWTVLVFYAVPVSEWMKAVLLAPLLTLYSSLQHEMLHGHPFRRRVFNDFLASLPLGVFIPYLRFRDTHLLHHRDTRLCDPYDDPESWYQSSSTWENRNRFSKALFNFNNTLAGRLAIGPVLGFWGFLAWDWRRIRSGERHVFWKWMAHFAAVVPMLWLIANFGSIDVPTYLIAAYGGMSLLMVRTFLEHQAHEHARGRSVIIERGGLFGFLFLNNSLHAVHHAHPRVAWYRLPELFYRNRKRFLAMNGGYRYNTYFEVFQKFLFRQKEPVPYPLKRRIPSIDED